ncbi:MAG: DUF1588 domain-containing protein [Archangiaceae bacterium]|nr:DUF1588 domain-containing protein [Archangiaceae bacterium]
MPAADALERVLASTQAREKLMRFFVAWLEIREADELTLSPAVFPEFTPAFAAAARAETLAFLQAALSKSTPTLKDITQAVPANAPDAHRLGVFTTAATIASHSGPTTTRLVKRGVFFTRKVMCIDLGNPPPDANTTLPTDGGATERERVETATTPARCQGCHAYINPFGFMQENYDALGRWRTTDDGAPIDAHVKIPWLDEGPLETSSPTEAFKAITSSARFKQCFVKQLFRFYLGRDEQPGDAALMRDMFFWFAHDDEQDLLKLLRTLSTSPRFSTRT